MWGTKQRLRLQTEGKQEVHVSALVIAPFTCTIFATIGEDRDVKLRIEIDLTHEHKSV